MTQAEHAREHFTGGKRPDKAKFSKQIIGAAIKEVKAGFARKLVAKKYGISDHYLWQLVSGRAKRN